jgi:hypothetical protein
VIIPNYAVFTKETVERLTEKGMKETVGGKQKGKYNDI